MTPKRLKRVTLIVSLLLYFASFLPEYFHIASNGDMASAVLSGMTANRRSEFCHYLFPCPYTHSRVTSN